MVRCDFGNANTQVEVSSNGYLTFGLDGTEWFNETIPTTTTPNDLIAPFWDDWEVQNGGARNIRYQTFGSSPNRYTVIHWNNVRILASTGTNDFEAIFYEDGRLQCTSGRLKLCFRGEVRNLTDVRRCECQDHDERQADYKG